MSTMLTAQETAEILKIDSDKFIQALKAGESGIKYTEIDGELNLDVENIVKWMGSKPGRKKLASWRKRDKENIKIAYDQKTVVLRSTLSKIVEIDRLKAKYANACG
jgi:hypothetical protein